MIKVDMDMRMFKAAMRLMPKEIRKTAQKLLNDEAFEFKAVAPKIIDKHMEVRNQGFVSRAFRVEKVKPGQSVDKMEAVAGSVAKEPSANGGGFSGWAEQEGEPLPAFMKNRHLRSIGKNARGGSMSGLPPKKARLTGDIIDMGDLERGPTMPTEESTAQAAIAIAAANKGKGGTVILRGGGFTPGLYGITHVSKPGQYKKKIKKTGDKAVKATFIRVEILQGFDEEIAVKRVP
ncbi:MAG: hypothetical protein LBP74_06620 [Treponema sp.]|nr:hypothetical protein [Treponema sp.]